MKTVFLIIAVAFALYSSAQIHVPPDSLNKTSNHELALQYISKGKQQNKTSNILLISGSALVVTGIVVALIGLDYSAPLFSPDAHANGGAIDAGGIMALGGCGLIATGIPFKYISRHNLKKGRLLLQSNNALPSASFNKGRIYSVGIQISL